jgi:hypothetical protein
VVSAITMVALEQFMKKTMLFTLSAALLGANVPSDAHHSTNLWYDVTKTQTIQGTFKDMLWINPHTVLHVVVAGRDGTQEIWSIETHANAVLARAGWRPDQFQAGEKVTVIGNPSRKGATQLSLLEVKTEDGRDFKVNAAK